MLFSPRRTPAVAYALVFIFLLGAAALVARWEEARDRVTLDVLSPVVMTASNIGAPLIVNVRSLVAILAVVIVLLGAIAVSLTRAVDQGWHKRSALFGVFVFAIAAQVSFLWGLIALGIAAIAVALVLATLASDDANSTATPATFEWVDFGVLLAITLLAFVVRLFALNRLPGNFEGELSPYYLGATTAGGILPANAGTAGPWAPLGLLFYVPIYLAIQFFGATVLAIRFSTAAVSLATLPLLYYFALVTFGRSAAVLAATFFVLDPLQIGWGRTDVHPHGVTTWPAILIALVTFRAFTVGTVRYFVLLAGLMALAWHQYPSGQLAAFIPLIVGAIMLIRRERIERPRTKLAILSVGLILWAAGSILSSPNPLMYVQKLGPRVAFNETAPEATLAERVVPTVTGAASLGADLVKGLFVKMPYRFHQDILVEISQLPTRSTPWLVGALVIAAICLLATRPRTTRDYVIIAWVIAAAAPAMFSDWAYPKRAATLFPALFVLAAGAGARFIQLVSAAPRVLRFVSAAVASLAVAAWFCATASLWFSGTRIAYGKPGELVLAERLAPHLRPGTIVIANIWENYGRGRLSYVLNDDLTALDRQPLLWYIVDPDRDLAALVADPTLAVSYSAPDRFYYRWSQIGERRDQALAHRDWYQAIFLLQAGLNGEALRQLKTGYPFEYSDAERLELLRRRDPPCAIEMFPPENCDLCGFIIARCPLRSVN